MTNEELVQLVLSCLGGKDNILSITNCQTRLRIRTKNDGLIEEDRLKKTEGILGIVHNRINYIEVVVGPGKCRKCADICADMGIPSDTGEVSTRKSWQENKAAVGSKQKTKNGRTVLKTIGEIFVPLLPGIITAGLCGGISMLLQQILPGWASSKALSILITLLNLINSSFMGVLAAWAGYRSAEKFGGTPILGGMLGIITGLSGINEISTYIGWFNVDSPLDSFLRSGCGGVLAVVTGVYLMVKIEKVLRKKIPESLDTIFTPFITLIITLIPYIFIIMPVCGLISTGLCWIVQRICMSDNVFIRVIAGYILAALFLPMVAMGMHHALVALYIVQLEHFSYIILYPSLAMAGAGQVGAAIAIYIKAKKVNNRRIQNVIRNALPAGILGIGEPLIYGVTLPMGKPFITAGLGAGFGGAFVMAMQVASTTWGLSGIMALFVMTAGPNGAVLSIVYYVIGLVISCIMSFFITNVIVKSEEVANA
jgi:PTS system sucrose-specific IIC component